MSEERNKLKLEIIDFLRAIAVKGDKWAKALGVVKNAAFEWHDVNSSLNADIKKAFKKYLRELPVEQHRDFNPVIARSFGPRYYLTIKGFVLRYEVIFTAEIEAERLAEEAVEDELEKQRQGIFDDDYEYGDIPGEVTIYNDCILVHASGYREGFQDDLPSGWKYEGKGCWSYPITMREVFDQGLYFQNMPVLVAKR